MHESVCSSGGGGQRRRHGPRLRRHERQFLSEAVVAGQVAVAAWLGGPVARWLSGRATVALAVWLCAAAQGGRR